MQWIRLRVVCSATSRLTEVKRGVGFAHYAWLRYPFKTMLFPRRQLRSWATCVLAMWVFGIGAGLGNTCLAAGTLDAGDRGRESSERASRDAETPRAIQQSVQGHGHTSDAGDHSGAHDKANCQDFCDKVTLSPPINKSTIDDLDRAVALPSVAIFFPGLAVAHVPSWGPRTLGSHDPPVRIAFARLTL